MQKQKLPLLSLGKKEMLLLPLFPACWYLSPSHAANPLSLLLVLLILSRVLLALSLALAFMLVSSWARVQVEISATIAVRSMRLGKNVPKNKKIINFFFRNTGQT
jgi:hypothetical protein